MNVFGVARFAADPELRQVGDTCVAELRLVFNERNKTSSGEVKEVPHFLDFVAWDKAAELISKYFQKGDAIVVKSATPRQDRWERDGKKHSKVVFRLNEFEFPPSNPRKMFEDKKPTTVKEEQVSEPSPF